MSILSQAKGVEKQARGKLIRAERKAGRAFGKSRKAAERKMDKY